MNGEFAQELCRLNERFYADQSASFSATRGSSWEGWSRVVEAMRSVFCVGDGVDCVVDGGADVEEPLRVLDVACGNLRFERFLPHLFPRREVRFVAVDDCDALLPDEVPDGVEFRHVDVMSCLQRMAEPGVAGLGAESEPGAAGAECASDRAGIAGLGVAPGSAAAGFAGGPADAAAVDGAFDAVACFGFMHHVPLASWRLRLLDAMIEAVRPGGLAVVSLWRFADNGYLAEKARRTTVEACVQLAWDAAELDEGDFLLGWQDRPAVYRYCHSFTDEEVDALVRHAAGGADPRAELVMRFRADGRTHDLNEYLILQRC